MKRVLAFSSSRAGDSEYLELVRPVVHDFLANDSGQIAFIPFASVDSGEDYTRKVAEAMNLQEGRLLCVNRENAQSAIESCAAIFVGGGNTCKLLHDLYITSLLTPLRTRIAAGIPYIGWSAGSNILGPTICTTNDMPIIAPPSLDALGIFNFQINPHYYNASPSGFHGETRDQRLTEYLKLNTASTVIALPEGSFLRKEGDHIIYQGPSSGYLLKLAGNTVQKSPLEPGVEIVV